MMNLVGWLITIQRPGILNHPLEAFQGGMCILAQGLHYLPYSPENKPPPLCDLQVLPQVFLPCL